MKTVKIPPKLAVINDLSGYGRCSLSVTIPVISALKVQACPVPTSVFSNHMGFPTFYKKDLSKSMMQYLRAWDEIGLQFDGIYCGFFTSSDQIREAMRFIEEQRRKNPSCLLIVDPVMGDHGNCYQGITPDFCMEMRNLAAKADIITPNLTESSILAGEEYRERPSREDCLLTAQRLHKNSAAKVILTGIQSENGKIANYVYESPDRQQFIWHRLAGENRPGTGDIFSSVIAADAVNQAPLFASVKKAGDFIACCIQASNDLKMPLQDGICFENFLDSLMKS